jgi:photosystem II stability/assembly factor-like uncharacterized protein
MAEDTSVLRGGQARIFVQADGISPAFAYEYFGCMQLDGPSKDLGEPDPVYCPSSSQRDKWDIIDEVPKTEALGTTDFTQRMDRFLRDAWWDIKQKKCLFNAQIVISNCARPDDFNNWEAKILLDRSRLTNFTLPTFNPLTGDDNAALDLTGSLTFRDFSPIRPLRFGEVLDTTIVAEALDAIYYDILTCGECGTPSDGCQKAYILTRANTGSPGLSSQLVYTLDGGSTGAGLDIPALGGLSGNRLAAVGNYLVVVSEAAQGHAYSLFSNVDAGVTAWTLVTSGYVAGAGPRALWSKSPSETLVAASDGYIYLMTNPTQAVTVVTDGSITTQNLNDIHGHGRVVVAVGDSNAVLVSTNGGNTFSLITGPLVGQNLSAVWVLNDNIWFIGTGNGNLYYTTNGGDTWTENTPDANITTINDIQFSGDVVGALAVQVGGASRVYRTTDSGYSWWYTEPAITGLPTAERYNTVAVCGNNNVLAAGRVSSGGDGIACIAA